MTAQATQPPRERTMAELVLWSTGALWVVIVVAHVLTQLTWRFRHSVSNELRPLLTMSEEQSLLTWLTVCLGFVLGASCLFAWRQSREWGWVLVGALFLYISFDDATMLHERIGWLVERKQGHGLVYRWVQWLGPVFAVAGIAAFGFLWRVFRGDRGNQVRVFLAFALLGLALGFEVFEKPLQDSGLEWRGFSLERYTIVIEESLELFAPAILLSVIGGLVERRMLERKG